MPSATASTREREQLARAGARDLLQQPGDDAPADDQHQRDEHRHLAERHAERAQQRCAARLRAGAQCRRAIGERRQQHQREHHHEVLDDQPADGDAAVRAIEHARAPRARAAARRCSPPTAPGRTRGPRRGSSPSSRRASDAERRRRPRSARPRPARRCARTASRSAMREVQADAEHQQDHADLGQLRAPGRVGDEAGRERPDQRRPRAGSRPAAAAAGAPRGSRGRTPAEGRGDGRDEAGLVRQGSLLTGATRRARMMTAGRRCGKGIGTGRRLAGAPQMRRPGSIAAPGPWRPRVSGGFTAVGRLRPAASHAVRSCTGP